MLVMAKVLHYQVFYITKQKDLEVVPLAWEPDILNSRLTFQTKSPVVHCFASIYLILQTLCSLRYQLHISGFWKAMHTLNIKLSNSKINNKLIKAPMMFNFSSQEETMQERTALASSVVLADECGPVQYRRWIAHKPVIHSHSIRHSSSSV